ncbi:MAG: VapC toxin family PIN domain ribonuclease [Mesorhizobium amorphae]|nr:MAG: VapC toxin family PIN domain ribonuclease [Mesorhizobium amorphae]
MIVDASAILAVLFDEPEGETIGDILTEQKGHLAISPFDYLEAAVRVDRFESPRRSAEFDNMVALLGIEIVKTTDQQAFLAREAYQRFGKGNHPARLNLGDCFAYALAKARAEPLLFKGDDFRQTDVEAVL